MILEGEFSHPPNMHQGYHFPTFRFFHTFSFINKFY
jgi:hypothetical protein